MNFVIFISIGIFASLFLLISAHFHVFPKNPSDFNPTKVAKVIRAEQRKNMMIAQAKYGIGITINPVQITKNPDETKPILPTNIVTPEGKSQISDSHLFSRNGLYFFIKKALSEIFYSEK